MPEATTSPSHPYEITHRPQAGKTVRLRAINGPRMQVESFLYPERTYWRPKTRADCDHVARPCPYVGCRHKLHLDVPTGNSIKFNHGSEDVDHRRSETNCSLDLADESPMTLDDIAAQLDITRERARQIELEALAKLAGNDTTQELVARECA